MKSRKFIAWLTGLLTLTLAVFAFILSFNALTDLATKHGVSIPPLFPFVVEFAVVIFSLNALYRSLNGESAKWQWFLIIGSSILAGTFNVAHAQSDLLSQTMAAMPSLFLLLSFESLLSLVKQGVKNQDKQERKVSKVQAEKVSLPANEPIAQDNLSLANEARQNQVSQRRQQVLSLVNAGKSQAEIASELQVSIATIKRDARNLSLNGRSK